jgi:hypothetical protein
VDDQVVPCNRTFQIKESRIHIACLAMQDRQLGRLRAESIIFDEQKGFEAKAHLLYNRLGAWFPIRRFGRVGFANDNSDPASTS